LARIGQSVTNACKIVKLKLEGFNSHKSLAFSCQSVIFLREDKSMDQWINGSLDCWNPINPEIQ